MEAIFLGKSLHEHPGQFFKLLASPNTASLRGGRQCGVGLCCAPGDPQPGERSPGAAAALVGGAPRYGRAALFTFHRVKKKYKARLLKPERGKGPSARDCWTCGDCFIYLCQSRASLRQSCWEETVRGERSPGAVTPMCSRSCEPPSPLPMGPFLSV